METRPHRSGYAALQRFRDSKPWAAYFITTNLWHRGRGLEGAELTGRVMEEWRRIESSGGWTMRSAVVMPDHVHLLVEMGPLGSLAESMRLFKGRLSRDLRRHELRWQEGFYEHRIRESEDLLPVFLYIFLNPYRAGLLTEAETWPGYYCCAEDWDWFGALTREAGPQPEWLR